MSSLYRKTEIVGNGPIVVGDISVDVTEEGVTFELNITLEGDKDESQFTLNKTWDEWVDHVYENDPKNRKAVC